MNGSENIVVRGVNWLGDAVMSTPALLRLREAKPGARITIITPEKLADLWKHHPAIDDVLAFTSEETAWQIGRRLRWGTFTQGLVFPNSPRSAIELWLGRVPERIGYSRPWRNFFLTKAVSERRGKVAMHKRSAAEVKRLIATDEKVARKFPTDAHQIHDYLDLVAAVGANPEPVPPQILVTDEEARTLRRRLLKDRDSGEVFFGINPGAEYGPAKRWPKERFIAVALEVQKHVSCRWLIFGGRADIPLAEEIAAGVASTVGVDQVINLAGRTTLRELCVALKLCRVVLTNDTGPAHVAAAVGSRIVVPFGSTSPELTAPGFPDTGKHQFLQAQVSCSPCFLRECPIDFRCMNSLEVSSVVKAFLNLVKNS